MSDHEKILAALGCNDLSTLIPQRFLDQFGLNAPSQYGMICRDVPTGIQQLESLGTSPFFHLKAKVKGWREAGETKTVGTDAAFGYTQGQQIELLGPGENTNLYTDTMPSDNSIKLHHICVLQFGLDNIEAQLNTAGYATHIAGDVGKKGIYRTRFRYFDTRAELGFWLEVTEYETLGKHSPPSEGLITSVANIQKFFSRRR